MSRFPRNHPLMGAGAFAFWETKMGQIYSGLLIGFAGIVLGFALTQLGNYLQTYREDKRVLKRVLYNQLDIWFELKRGDFDTLVPLMIDRSRQALLKRGTDPNQIDAMFAQSFPPIINILRTLKLSSPERLEVRYQESVNRLAEVDPLLAYRLSGRADTGFTELVDTYIDRVVGLENREAQAASLEMASFVRSVIKGYGQQKLLTNMETDILEVAKRISYRTRYRTRQKLNKLTIKLSEEADKYVEHLLDSVSQVIVKGSHSAPQPPA